MALLEGAGFSFGRSTKKKTSWADHKKEEQKKQQQQKKAPLTSWTNKATEAVAQSELKKAQADYAAAQARGDKAGMAAAARAGDAARVKMGQAPQNTQHIANLEKSSTKEKPPKAYPSKETKKPTLEQIGRRVASQYPQVNSSKSDIKTFKDIEYSSPNITSRSYGIPSSWSKTQPTAAQNITINPTKPKEDAVLVRGGNNTGGFVERLGGPLYDAQQAKLPDRNTSDITNRSSWPSPSSLSSHKPQTNAVVNTSPQPGRQEQATAIYNEPGGQAAAPVTTDTSGLAPGEGANQGVITVQAPTTGLVPNREPEPPVDMPPQDIFNNVVTWGTEISRIIQQGQPDTLAMVAQAQNQFYASLERMTQEITAMFQQQMANLDPATMAALNALKETVNEQRNRLMDEMNRRGLLQSGIWLQMEDRINKNQLTSEQQMLATRLTNLQNQMLSSLQSFAQMRIQAQQQFSLAGIQAVENQAARQQQQVLAGLQMASDTARWQSEQQLEQSRWQQQQNQAYQQWLADFNQRYADQYGRLTGTIPQGYTGASGQQYTFPNAGQPTFDARQAQQQSISGSTQNSSLTNQYIQQITSYGSLDEALADFNRYRSIMEAQGVNTQAVINAIYGYFGR